MTPAAAYRIRLMDKFIVIKNLGYSFTTSAKPFVVGLIVKPGHVCSCFWTPPSSGALHATLNMTKPDLDWVTFEADQAAADHVRGKLVTGVWSVPTKAECRKAEVRWVQLRKNSISILTPYLN